jgi:hypothetical protein
MTDSDDVPPNDPIEDAWFEQDGARVLALARARLATNEEDLLARGWVTVGLAATGAFSQASATLKQTVDGLAQQLERADEDRKDELRFERAALAGRFLEAAGDVHVVDAAKLLVESLSLEHPPALRVLAAEALAGANDAARAMALVKRALAVDPSDSEALYLGARAAARAGRKPNVMSLLQKALEFADGTIAVRLLARYEPDFDGLRSDAEFTALIDPLPREEPLRRLYQALEAGRLDEVVSLAAAAKAAATNRLDVLYPWREALELLLDRDGSGSRWEAPLEALQAEVDAHEAKDEESVTWARFCGDA